MPHPQPLRKGLKEARYPSELRKGCMLAEFHCSPLQACNSFRIVTDGMPPLAFQAVGGVEQFCVTFQHQAGVSTAGVIPSTPAKLMHPPTHTAARQARSHLSAWSSEAHDSGKTNFCCSARCIPILTLSDSRGEAITKQLFPTLLVLSRLYGWIFFIPFTVLLVAAVQWPRP